MKRKIIKYSLLFSFIAVQLVVDIGFIAMQFKTIERTNPDPKGTQGVTPKVDAILRRSCYDCHSYETRWPWYGYVAPISWGLAYTISDARSEFNLSDWKAYRPDKRRSLLRDALEMIDEEAMPPWEYLLMHGEARLSESERKILRDWIMAAED